MQQPKGKTKKKEPVNLCYDSELGFLPCDEVDKIRAEEEKEEYKRKEKEIKLKGEENKKQYEYIITHPLDQRYPTETVYGSFDKDGNFTETTKGDYESNNPLEIYLRVIIREDYIIEYRELQTQEVSQEPLISYVLLEGMEDGLIGFLISQQEGVWV